MEKTPKNKKELIAERQERYKRLEAALRDAGLFLSRDGKKVVQGKLGAALYPTASQGGVGGWKSGRTTPSPDHLTQISAMTGYCFEYLWMGRGEEKSEHSADQTPKRMVQLLEALRAKAPTGAKGRLYSIAPVGMCYFDVDLRYLYVNDWLARINGISVEDHVGKTIYEVLPHVAIGVAAQLNQVLSTGKPIISGEVEIETPAHPGVLRKYIHNFFPDKDDRGEVIGVSCVVQDITDQAKLKIDSGAPPNQEQNLDQS